MWRHEELKAGFVANKGWLTKFMEWNNLSMQTRTTIAQKDPSHPTTNLVKAVHENKLFTRLYNYNG